MSQNITSGEVNNVLEVNNAICEDTIYSFEIICSVQGIDPINHGCPVTDPSVRESLDVFASTMDCIDHLGSTKCESLEPLFSEFPSVDHNYTNKLELEHQIGYRLSADLCKKGDVLIFWETSKFNSNYAVKPYEGSLNYLMSVVNNNTSTVDDVAALPENIASYSHLLRLVSARSARLESLRVSALSHALCSRNFCFSTYPTTPTHIWYDYIYMIFRDGQNLLMEDR